MPQGFRSEEQWGSGVVEWEGANQLISSRRGALPCVVSGARWMQGGTGLPGYSTAMRQRWPTPKENGRACGTGA